MPLCLNASDPAAVEAAAQRLAAGSLVGMPTETVYGLAANALDFLADSVTYAVSLWVIGRSVRLRAGAALAKSASLVVLGTRGHTGLAGVLMVTGVLHWVSIPVALFIGTIGAVSVFKAVYIDRRELKCACVGGSSNVPHGFVSLTENIMMIAMALWMSAKMVV